MTTKENEIATIAQGPTPSALLQLAVQQNLDIDKLEKLMQLQERWEQNKARKSFLEAMSEFQSKCPILTKSKKVGFTTKAGGTVGYSYVPLGEIARQIKDVLNECGLSYRWETKDDKEAITITCIVSHKEGHEERNTMSAKKDDSGQKNAIQQQGSTITYLQRYTLIGALGISSADADVDGQQPDKKSDKVELTPGNPKWKDAIDALAKDTVTIVQIKKRYNLSDENEKLLKEEVIQFKINANI